MTGRSERAAVILAYALALVKGRGEGREVSKMNPVLAWTSPPWSIMYRTPHQPILKGHSGHPPQMDNVLEDYGLDVWRDGRVFSVEWAEEGVARIVWFEEGPWEAEFLAL